MNLNLMFAPRRNHNEIFLRTQKINKPEYNANNNLLSVEPGLSCICNGLFEMRHLNRHKTDRRLHSTRKQNSRFASIKTNKL